MLREQVLDEWNGCKEKMISFKKFIDLLDEEVVLPGFPLGLDTIKRNLDFWTTPDYCQKLEAGKKKILAEISQSDTIMSLQMNYVSSVDMFKELTQGWKKEIDNHSGSEPTIEEVDD